MRILVTRPLRDAQRFAAQLEQAGHETLISPVLDMAATSAPLPRGLFDAVIATSAYGFEFLPSSEADFVLDRALPVYAVGTRTRDAALDAGFSTFGGVAADATSLTRLIERGAHEGARLIYLAGADRKHAFETHLRAAGFDLEIAIVYEARATDAFSTEAAEALRHRRVEAVTHFSRRSAEIFWRLAQAAGVFENACVARHLCLSADVAAAMPGALTRPPLAASAPDAASMVRLAGM